MYWWLCDCGWKSEETGDGKGMAAMGSHLASYKRRGGGPHKCLGLVDPDGTVHIQGLNPSGALEAGYITPKDQREEAQAEAASPEASVAVPGQPRQVLTPPRKRRPGGGGGDGEPKTPTNIQGLVQGWKIPLVGSLWGIYSLAVRMGIGRPRRHGATRYSFTQEGMAYFIQDVCEQWFVDNAPAVLGLTPRQLNQPDQRARLDRFISGVLGLTMENLESLVQDEDEAAGGE